MERYDAILIPGGGVRAGGELPEWSKRRFDRALTYRDTRYIICLSAGTSHRPPPLDEKGFPIYESVAGARYLLAAGVDESKIVTETCSYDTIGNAYFSRLIHVQPLRLKRLLVITSEFHFPRTKEIFTWVYGLETGYLEVNLDFVAVSDEGLDAGMLAARREKEAAGLENVKKLGRSIRSLGELHQWLFTQHDAYRAGYRNTSNISDFAIDSY